MKKVYTTLRFIIFALPSLVSFSLSHAYTLRQIFDKDKLSNSCVVSLCQDRSGLLWIGTIDGINSYNGREVRPFLYDRDKKELSGSVVEQLIETQDGQLWAATLYGLDRYDKYRNRLITYKNFSKNLCLDKDSRNTLFVIPTDHRLFYFLSEDDVCHEMKDVGLAADSIVNMVITPNDEMTLFHKNGDIAGYRISYEKNVPRVNLSYRYKHTAEIEICKTDGDDIFFVDANLTLFQFDYRSKNAEQITSLTQFAKHGSVQAVVRFAGDYFIGFKTGGIWTLNISSGVERWEEIPINCGVCTLMKDRYQDIIWIASDGKGVYAYSDDEYSISSTFSSDISKLLGRPVRCMHLEKGDLWIGYKGDGIVKIDDYTPLTDLRHAHFTHFTASDSRLTDNRVFAFEPGDNDILWIGHHEGLNYYSYRTRTIERLPFMCNGEPIRFVHDIYQQDNYLWIASVIMGVYKAKISWRDGLPTLTVVKHFVLDGGDIYSNLCFSLYPDGDYLFVANRGKGVMKIDTRDDSYSMLRFDSRIPNETVNDIFCISKDDDGNYLFGTGLGLVIYHPDGEYELLNRTNGFPENMIRGIIKTGKNRFWLATNHGLINFDSRTRLAFTFGVQSGLNISEFSDAAQYRTEDGEYVMFGGVNGFITIRENAKSKPSIHMPDIQFDRLSVLGVDYAPEEFFGGGGNFALRDCWS